MKAVIICLLYTSVPGGGGASALVGAVGTALGAMVGNLTLGKKKYADVQEDIKQLLIKAEGLQNDMLELINKDALAFEPLSKAYGLPKDTPEQQQYKAEVMENALKAASSVPYEIMEKCMEAIDLHLSLIHIYMSGYVTVEMGRLRAAI